MTDSILNAEPIAKQLHAAFCHDADQQTLLQLAADKIREAGPPYTSVYMYMLNNSGDALSLEAFSGRETEHTAIPVGRGMCGKAVRDQTDLNIADVTQSPEYLACNIDTRSELIVLIHGKEGILGQIDIDSDVVDGFSDAEHVAVKTVADALSALL